MSAEMEAKGHPPFRRYGLTKRKCSRTLPLLIFSNIVTPEPSSLITEADSVYTKSLYINEAVFSIKVRVCMCVSIHVNMGWTRVKKEGLLC